MKNVTLKKVVAAILTGVMVTGIFMTGCGNNTGSDSSSDSGKGEDNKTSSSNIDNEENAEYEKWKIVLGGEEITFPCTYSEFKKTGYSLPEEEEQELFGINTVADFEHRAYYATNANGDQVRIALRNYSKEEDIKTEDAVVLGVEIDGYTDFNYTELTANQDFALWGELKFGDSAERIEELTGYSVQQLREVGACDSWGYDGELTADGATLRFYVGENERTFCSVRIMRGADWDSMDEYE